MIDDVTIYMCVYVFVVSLNQKIYYSICLQEKKFPFRFCFLLFKLMVIEKKNISDVSKFNYTLSVLQSNQYNICICVKYFLIFLCWSLFYFFVVVANFIQSCISSIFDAAIYEFLWSNFSVFLSRIYSKKKKKKKMEQIKTSFQNKIFNNKLYTINS